ncbi:hypothetical protein [Pseudofrankia asymbiotica]|uniref:PknH-like extracellular domain-containing protein n=1 Tax=Pseudofrankia asymbiotica TaxID=1834516 RepID=A0A1V2I9Q7_9ACTN|nr:hypothetical protein [Pseudofrankia asymbiotica]ONH29023.1 hypothetical protein BL253_17805 [Pseudofrankia asymbiotica]
MRSGRERTRVMAAAGAAGLVLALAGCGLMGSDSNDDAAATGQPSAPIVSDSPAAVVTTAAAAPLRAADFTLTNSSGFTGFSPANGATGADAGAAPFAALASCLGISAADATDRSTDRAESTHLTNSGTGTTIWSDAQIVSAVQFDRDTGLLRHPRFADCVTAQAKKDADAAFLAKYGADGVFDAEAVTRDDAPLPAGALARTSVVVIAGTANGGQAQLFYDTIYLGSGQVEAQLHLVSSVDPPSEDLVSVAAAQLAAKLGQR